MFQPPPFYNYDNPNNNDSQDIGAKIGLLGAIISTIGDGLGAIGAAISIEEARIADAQQQQTLQNLQESIDDLKKGQVQGEISSIDKLNCLLEKLIDRLDKSNDVF